MEQSLVQQKESLSRRARFLRLASRTIAENMKSGTFRSLYRGQGVEFSGVRDYIRGDDIRAIDWNVTARMGKPFVKMFEEERELNVFFVFDCSASLFEGSGNVTKIEAASECAALLTFAAEQNGCPIGCVFFDGEIKFSLAPKSGAERTMVIVKKLDAFASGLSAGGNSSASGDAFAGGGRDCIRGSVLPDALAGAFSILRKRSLVFILSDFRVAGYEVPLAKLAHKHDCVAIKVSLPSDMELPQIGTIPFSDSETSFGALLPTNSSAFKKEWKQAEMNRVARWHDVCAKRGVFPIEISAGEDIAAKLVSFFERKRQSV